MTTSISKLSRFNVLFSTVAMFVLSVVASKARAQNTLDLAGLSATSQIEVAYSMRRLSTSYTGSLIQVRRSSDNTTSDIGYDASGHLDTGTLKSFVGAGNGFVKIWYDQSGNGNDAFQSTAGSQPIIVSSGVILRKNSRPVIRFNGTNYMDGGTTPYGITNDRTLNAVFNVQSGSPSAIIDRTPSSNPMFVINGNNTGYARNDAYSGVSLGAAITAPFTNTFTFTWESDGKLNLYQNSILEDTASKSLPCNMNVMRIGRHVSVVATAEINFWEIVLLSSAITPGERQVLDCGQQNYYNIVPDAIGGTATVCAGSTTTLTHSVSGGTWSSSATSIATIGSSTGIVTGVTPGTATITYTRTTDCTLTNPIIKVVTVNASSSIDTISGNNSVCSGQTTTLTCTTPGGTWSSSSTATGSISSTGVVTGIAGGSYTITYRVSSTCGTYTSTKSMLGYLTPTIGISVGSNNSCVGATATYTATPTTGYTWTSSNGAVGTINTGGSVYGISAGTTTLSYTHNTAGCRATAVQTVNAIPSFSITTPVCATTTQTLTGTPAGGTWTSSNTSVATIGSASGIFSTLIGGTTNIQYTYGPCSATTAASVSAMPGAITGPTSVCSGSTTQLSSGTASQTWSVANTAIATITTLNTTTSVVTGVSTGTTTVSYTNASNCSRIVTLTVTSPMTANTGTTLYCMGQTATLSNATTGGAWTSGATGVATINSSTGLITPISTGTSGITYSTTSPSSCQTTTEVTVNAALTANTGTANVCVGQTTTLANSTSGGTWISSNANATVGSATGVVTGVTAGNSTITYYKSDACYKNTALTVNANPASISGTLSACEAAATPTLTCTTASGTWSSSNTLVATIGSSTGAVTPLSAGTTTITYKLTTTGCYSTATFTVNPTPVSFTASSAVCTGATTTISTTPAGGTWESSTTAVASIGSSSGVLTGNTAGTTKITYTLATGCSRNETITVNASPATITGTLSACEGSTSTLSNTTSGGTWLSSNTAIATVGSATGTVTGVASGTSTITYKLSSSGCYASATFTVNPAPAAITGTLYTCVGSTTTLANSVTGGTWSSSATAVATIGSANGTVTGIADGTSTITYTLSAGCNTTTTYTVNANPQAITGTTNACEGSSSTLANTTSGGTWLSSNTAVATVGSSTGSVTGVTYGTSAITYQLSTTGCYSTTTFTVNQTPSVIGGTLSACAGASTTLTNTVTGGTWTSTTTSVATIGSSNGIVTGVASGTSEITYALAAGCYKTAVVTINAVPMISGTVELCDGSSTTLTATPTGGTWTSGSPAVVAVDSLTGEITGVSGGTSRITYTGTNTCRAVVQVSVNASMGGAISGPSGVCNGFTATMTHAASGGTWTSSDTTKATINASTGLLTALSVGSTTVTYSLGGTCFRTKWVAIQIQPEPITGNTTICNGSYSVLSSTVGGSGTWSSADTTIANPDLTSGMISGMSVGTTTITYRIPVSGCKVTTTVNVVAGPTAISGTLFVCQGSSVSPTSTPTGGTWAISNEGVATIDSATGVISGVSSGYATVSYTLSTGCRVTAEVTVSNMPAAISGTLALCPAGTTTLSSAPTGGTWTGSTPGVATISSAGVVSPVATGTTTITYTLSSSCARTAIVTVNSVPPAITGEGTVCVGSGTTLSNTSTGGTWMSGNTAKATVGLATGLVTGISTGTAVISYFVSGPGCYTTRVQTISATPAAISGTMNACIGETSTLSHAISGGTWSSGNTSIATVDASGVVTAVSAGYAMITYQTTPGCWVTGSFNSKALPAAITGTPYACVGTTTSLLSITTLGVWTSSNTGVATIQSPSGTVTGISAGTATITYKLTSGCYRTTEVTVSAAPATISGPSALCRTASTTLTCTPTGGTWISSTPAAATINSATGELTGVAAGTTRITYTQAVTGCRSVKTMTIGAPPAAIAGTLSTCAGSTTTLTDATTGGTWSSSDVSTATIGSSTGVATAVATGTATVSYNHSGGCVATAILTVTPAVGTSSGDTTLCVGGTTTLTNTAGGGTWVSSTTAKATVGSATGIVKGIATGTATITYKVNPSCFNTRIVTVSATPVAIGGPTYVCINTDGSFTHAVSGGTWSSSNPAVGSIDGSTGVFRGITAGAVVITYITGNGCFVTKSVNVANNPPAITGNLAVCAASSSALTCIVGGSATWSSSNTAVGTIGSTSGMLAGLAAGTTTVTYRLNTTGCYSTATATINPLPATISGSNTICAGSTQTYSSTTTGGTWTSSNASAASIGSTSGAATGITAGVVTLSYTISTGCRTTKTITVNSLPAAITGTSSYCVGGSATLASATTGGTWSSDNAAATVAGSGTVTATTAGTSVISYTLATGCARYATVTVNAALPANTGNNTICVGGATTLANTTGGGTWASSATTKATVGSATGIVTGVATGTANISFIRSGAGCISVTQVTINAALATITGTANACVGTSSTLVHTISGGTWSSSNTAMATVDASSGVVSGISAGIPVITYTASPGCYKTANFTVKALPSAITGNGSVCTGSATVLSGSPIGGTWASGNTGIATINTTTGALNGVTAGTVVITYKGANGCYISTTRTVNAAPASITGTFTAAVGGSRTLSNATPSGTWTSSNSVIASVTSATGVVTGIATGSALITYTVPNGCFKSVTFTVTAAKDETMSENNTPTFRVYPNPVSGILHLETSEAGTFRLFSIDGKCVLTAQVQLGHNARELPMELSAGSYIGQFTSETGNQHIVRLTVE